MNKHRIKKNTDRYTSVQALAAVLFQYYSLIVALQSVPYNLNLARGVYDKMMMTIMGHVKPNAKM